MALPTRPLSIKDACTTTRSIAQEVDGNLTGDKSLSTLGVSAGISTPDYAMSEFEGYASDTTVTYCRYDFAGSCGTPGPVTVCSCLINDPLMVLGDRYDATIHYLLKRDSGSGCACVTIRCNGALLFSTFRTIVGSTTSSYIAQNIDYNDKLTMCILATATTPASSVTCSCSRLCELTDQQQTSFVIGTANNNFVLAVCN